MNVVNLNRRVEGTCTEEVPGGFQLGLLYINVPLSPGDIRRNPSRQSHGRDLNLLRQN